MVFLLCIILCAQFDFLIFVFVIASIHHSQDRGCLKECSVDLFNVEAITRLVNELNLVHYCSNSCLRQVVLKIIELGLYN